MSVNDLIAMGSIKYGNTSPKTLKYAAAKLPIQSVNFSVSSPSISSAPSSATSTGLGLRSFCSESFATAVGDVPQAMCLLVTAKFGSLY